MHAAVSNAAAPPAAANLLFVAGLLPAAATLAPTSSCNFSLPKPLLPSAPNNAELADLPCGCVCGFVWEWEWE